jgi:hypothetical protein
MLGSINPLGERGRHSRWGVTVLAFMVGSVAAGSAVGAALGTAGTLAIGAVSPAVRAAMLGVAVLAGAAWDVGSARRGPRMHLPSPRRQVNEDWLNTYRGWVYGVAFGFQLGLGVATIVTTSAVYSTLAGAALTASWWGGLVVGATFGMARAAPVLAGAGIRHPRDLLVLDDRLRRWEPPSRVAAVVLQAGVAAAALGAAAAR